MLSSSTAIDTSIAALLSEAVYCACDVGKWLDLWCAHGHMRDRLRAGACVLTCMRWYLSKCTINDAHKTTNTTSTPTFYDACICACASISSLPTQNWLPAYLLHNRPRISIAHPQAEQAKSACVHMCVCVCVCVCVLWWFLVRSQSCADGWCGCLSWIYAWESKAQAIRNLET